MNTQAIHSKPIERINILGVGIHALNLGTALAAIRAALATKTKGYVCVTGVHGTIEAQDDPALKQIFNNSFLTTPDGMPMVWIGRLRGFNQISRVYGPDLLLEVCAASEGEGWRHFFYGGAPGVAEEMTAALKKRFPKLLIVGTHTPPFRPLTADEFITLQAQVTAAQPHIIWVGISTPKQDRFMAQSLPHLDTTLMFGIGAAFDFISGRVRQAPKWIQRSGLEWLYRLCHEPRRLWKRYLTTNPRFLWLTLLQTLRLKTYSINGQ